ncbi:FtsX-like permease family protein [Lactobacillus sp. ESL0791]|uniref:FtsX-like permease family protein n=1 Tax=Lactobacillus sp. ESL0791 TaxID=2983234 RepID=UPI0023F991A6|nr:FtsX-like permease family protein [Lactobacillus sp. ESL0791]MDF7639542.1 FtsX-like permease family protein [Lactobacillus sp. ESL0791]
MIWKLSFTGIKSRLKDYVVLFSGLVVASMIFYMFLTLAINPAFLKGNITASYSNVSFVFEFGIVLLAIITLVYLVYANSFLLNMRQHDYGMYMMLGAKSSRIGLLIFCETLITGILATVLGIILGFGLTALMSKILIANLGLQISHFQVILPSAILWTLVFFIAIFFLAALRNMHKLTHSKVIELLHESQKPVTVVKRPLWHTIEAVLGLVLLAIGYYIMGDKNPNAVFRVVPIALITIVLGSYFVFNSFFTAIISFLQKRKSFSYHGIRLFTLGQLKFRLHDYTKILTVISLLFALALGAITVGLNFNSIKDLAAESSYYDATVVSASPTVQKAVDKLSIKSKATYHYKETGKALYFDRADFTKQPLKKVDGEVVNDFVKYKTVTVPTNKLDVPRTDANNYLGGMVPNGMPKVIHLVSNTKLQTLPGQNKFITLLTINNLNQDYKKVIQLENLQIKENPALKETLQNTKAYTYQMMIVYVSGFEFMGFFLGLAFLTMLASTLMFKVLSGAVSDKLRYKMLYKIGARKKVLQKSIAHEIGILFLLPGFLGVIDVLFGLRLFQTLLPHPYRGFWLPFLIFIVLYFLYYFVTVKLYERIVLTNQLD